VSKIQKEDLMTACATRGTGMSHFAFVLELKLMYDMRRGQVYCEQVCRDSNALEIHA
jgi:hypothetical protein